MRKVTIQVWSDNHGHDEMFGTTPNKPHYLYDDTVEVDDSVNDLEVAIQDNIRKKLMKDCEDLPIRVIAKNSFSQCKDIAEIRLRIANSEYVGKAFTAI